MEAWVETKAHCKQQSAVSIELEDTIKFSPTPTYPRSSDVVPFNISFSPNLAGSTSQPTWETVVYCNLTKFTQIVFFPQTL